MIKNILCLTMGLSALSASASNEWEAMQQRLQSNYSLLERCENPDLLNAYNLVREDFDDAKKKYDVLSIAAIAQQNRTSENPGTFIASLFNNQDAQKASGEAEMTEGTSTAAAELLQEKLERSRKLKQALLSKDYAQIETIRLESARSFSEARAKILDKNREILGSKNQDAYFGRIRRQNEANGATHRSNMLQLASYRMQAEALVEYAGLIALECTPIPKSKPIAYAAPAKKPAVQPVVYKNEKMDRYLGKWHKNDREVRNGKGKVLNGS